MTFRPIRVLLVEDDVETRKSVVECLARFESAKFEVHACENVRQALAELEHEPQFDLVLSDNKVEGINGLDVARAIKERKMDVPIVFLAANNDVGLAIEVMKHGVDDYLLKEEISTNLFPQTLFGLVERRRLKREVSELEVKKRRLEAMQQIVVGISGRLTEPLAGMKSIVSELLQRQPSEKASKYLEIMRNNIARMELKLEKLQNLQEDKTVQYIKDIRMIDLS
jgi:CheY-like chemotaxis protein